MQIPWATASGRLAGGYFYVICGTATLIIDNDAVEVGKGDLVQFPGNLPHTYRNLDERVGVDALSVVVIAV